MSSDKPKWWKTPPYSNIVGTLASTAILGLVKIIYDWLTNTPILSSFSDWFTFIKDSLLFVLEFKISLWIVCLTFICYSLIYWYLNRKKTKIIQENSSLNFDLDNIPDEVLKRIGSEIERDQNYDQIKKAEMLSDTAEKFDELIWKWSWKFNPIIKRYEAKNAAPLCPNQKCGNFELDYSGYNDEFGDYLYDCKLCGNNYPSSSHKSDIEKYIENKYKEINV